MAKTYQVAAIPVRRTVTGATEVLLVTSRGTRRWVVPKGWPWRNLADHEAAAGEAWEEAGVRGETNPVSIGTFSYKKRWNGGLRSLQVRVYVMMVTKESSTWPEAEQRQRNWCAPLEAAERVAEPELKELLRALSQEKSKLE